MRLSKKEMKEAIATLFKLLTKGRDDKEAMEEMGVDPDTYKAIRVAMMDAKADEIRTMPSEHLYVDYLLKQSRNIDDLTRMIDDFHRTKQYTALVGAIKARADIHDKLIKTGQEFGLIKREPKVTKVLGGLVLADMTNQELRKAITGELGRLGGLMKAYGESNVMELEAGPLHHGPTLSKGVTVEAISATDVTPLERFRETAKALPKTAKARTSKVSRGRKVVKRKKVSS